MKINMVISYRNRYFGIDFRNRQIKEITFKEAYGYDVFDWDYNIFIGSDYNKDMYDEMRGEDGTGFGRVFQIMEVKDAKEVKDE